MVKNMKKKEKKNSEKLSGNEYLKLVQKEKNFKESMPRPQVSYETWSNNFDAIFGKKKKKKNES